MVKQTWFGAVRRNREGREFVCPSETSGCIENVTIELARVAKHTPHWHKANVVKRIAKFQLTETE